MRYVLALLCASNDIRDDTRGSLGREEEDGATQGQGSEKSHFSLVSAVDMGHTPEPLPQRQDLRLLLCIRA